MALYAFDGTWNREHTGADYSKNSNVVRFAKAYQAGKAVYQKNGDQDHIVEDDDNGYISGPGTKRGRPGKLLGGIMGLGGRSRVAQAIKRVERRFAQGDTAIDVIGFSRGAAIALHFVNEVAEVGFFDGPDGKPVEARVRFLGLWDVVAAFGLAKDIGFLKFQKINLGWHLTLPDIVDHCYHALALDERRETFQPTRVDGAYEVWFRGVHSDIGGGNQNEQRNNIALRWMLRKAAAVRVPVDAGLADTLQVNEDAGIGQNKDPRRDPFRTVRATDLGHYTIKIRKEPEVCQNLPNGCQIETDVFEKTRISLV
jgi:uncharacterized protein (DUF2235 family)